MEAKPLTLEQLRALPREFVQGLAEEAIVDRFSRWGFGEVNEKGRSRSVFAGEPNEACVLLGLR